MTLPKSKLFAIALAMFALGTTAQLAAAPFVYVAPCLVQCSNIGLSDGDPVAASLSIDDAAVLPNNIVDLSSIQSFGLVAGNLSFTLPDLLQVLIVLDPTATFATSFALVAANASGVFIAINDGVNNAFLAGPNQELLALGGAGILFRTVAEPATLVLLGVAAILGGIARRRLPVR